MPCACTQVALIAAPPLLDVLIPFPVNVVLTSLFIIYIGSHMSMDPDLSTDEVWLGCWVLGLVGLSGNLSTTRLHSLQTGGNACEACPLAPALPHPPTVLYALTGKHALRPVYVVGG